MPAGSGCSRRSARDVASDAALADHPLPLGGRDVREATAPAVAGEPDDPRDAAQRALVVQQRLEDELGGRAGRRQRALALVDLLGPQVVAKAAEVLPEAIERGGPE